jgi:hypothetical protein
MTKIRCTSLGVNPRNGLDAAYPYLSIGSILLSASDYGTVSDYTQASSVFRFYAAGQEVDLSSAMLTVVPSNLRISYSISNEIGGLGKVVSIIQIASTYFQEWLDISFVYNGVTYKKRLNIAKVKHGGVGNQIIYNDSVNHVIAVSSVNPFTKTLTGMKLGAGDVITGRYLFSSTAVNSVVFETLGVSITQQLNSDPVLGSSFMDINIHVVNYNVSTGQLDFYISHISGNHFPSTSNSFQGYRYEHTIILPYQSTVYLTAGNPIISFGISTALTNLTILKNFSVEYKQNFNNTLFVW